MQHNFVLCQHLSGLSQSTQTMAAPCKCGARGPRRKAGGWGPELCNRTHTPVPCPTPWPPTDDAEHLLQVVLSSQLTPAPQPTGQKRAKWVECQLSDGRIPKCRKATESPAVTKGETDLQTTLEKDKMKTSSAISLTVASMVYHVQAAPLDPAFYERSRVRSCLAKSKPGLDIGHRVHRKS